MNSPVTPAQLETLRAYSTGAAGTRRTIEAMGMHDYADLIMALAQHGLDFPKPAASASHAANVARARSILLPRLRHGG